MSVTGIASTTTTTGSTKAEATNSSNFTNFLKLLTTQLQQQDPLSPMDATQFTNQLVQFTSVEQTIQMNKEMSKLNQMLQSNASASALNYIGREIRFDADKLALPATGSAQLGYSLARPAAEVSITIKDSAGRTVRELAGSRTAGSQNVAWDGMDATGKRAAPGTYTVGINATDSDGKAVPVNRETRGTVDAVTLGTNGLELWVGDLSVPIGQVKQVRAIAQAAAAA